MEIPNCHLIRLQPAEAGNRDEGKRERSRGSAGALEVHPCPGGEEVHPAGLLCQRLVLDTELAVCPWGPCLHGEKESVHELILNFTGMQT